MRAAFEEKQQGAEEYVCMFNEELGGFRFYKEGGDWQAATTRDKVLISYALGHN